MAFYSPDGIQKLTTKEFVDYYSNAYTLDGLKIHEIRYTQSSSFVEDEISRILSDGFKNRADIAKAMAWKLGRIKHRECMNEFIYSSDWECCEKLNPMHYGKELDLDKLFRFIIKNKDELERITDNDPQKCLMTLRDQGIEGLGTVYLITLLFFLSHGKHPIYPKTRGKETQNDLVADRVTIPLV